MLAGPASTLSPTAQLANAETRFNEQLALVQADNFSQINDFVAAAAQLRDLKREAFASGEMFQQFESMLFALLDNVLAGVPGFATQGAISAGSDSQLLRIQPSETATITRGPMPDSRPDIRELGRLTVSGNSEQAGLTRALIAEVKALRADNAELHFKLNRILSEPARRVA